MKCLLACFIGVAVSGCTISANAPIQANTQINQGSAGGNSTAGTTTVTGGTGNPSARTDPTVPVGGLQGAWKFLVSDALPDNAVVSVVDFNTVAVGSASGLSITTDAGKSWTKYDGVISNPVWAMYWKDAGNGWVATGKGSILKLSLSDGKVSSEVLDAGTTHSVTGLIFLDSNVGYLADAANDVYKTVDSGLTWKKSFNIVDSTYRGASTFTLDVKGGAYYIWNQTDGNGEAVYHLESGGFEKVSRANKKAVTNGDIVYLTNCNYYCKGSSDGSWDWNDGGGTGKIGPGLRTQTQIIKDDGLENIYPVSRLELLGQLKSGSLVQSLDGGQTWTDPTKVDVKFDWIKPFSGNRMWAQFENHLYRSK